MSYFIVIVDTKSRNWREKVLTFNQRTQIRYYSYCTYLVNALTENSVKKGSVVRGIASPWSVIDYQVYHGPRSHSEHSEIVKMESTAL